MTIPKAFISYSHDSMEHKQWVLDFATRLRLSSVDAILDQWELVHGDDLPSFMEKNLASADKVLMICTDKYVEKANNGTGGVGYEKMIVTGDLIKRIDSNKVIPVIRQITTQKVPVFLSTKLFVDFSESVDVDFAYDTLIRSITNKTLIEKPPITNTPLAIPQQAKSSIDGLKEVMKAIVAEFENSSDEELWYPNVIKRTNISRIYFDLYFDKALKVGLVRKYSHSHLILTNAGKHFAIENGLINNA